jgi:precorrin-6A synthase
MKKIAVIGIGAGDPEYITVQAIRAMNAVHVFFVLDKGEAKHELVRLREEICRRYIEKKEYRVVEIADPVRDPAIEDYTARVEQWHEQRALVYEQCILQHLGEHECGAFLVWGDPSLYDSTLRILGRVAARAVVSFELEVIPGITSAQALAARHKIALNAIGESVAITTGRRLSADAVAAAQRTVVMLDGNSAFRRVIDPDVEIYWGAYLGMEGEVLLSGKLSQLAGKIETVREQQRQARGWIMDIYLLARPAQPGE